MSEARIMIWCGQAANQKALANKIAKEFSIAGIVIDTGVVKKKKSGFLAKLNLVIDRLRFSSLYGAWKNLINYYQQKYPEWPGCPQIRVNGINSPETIAFTARHDPDLVIVSGTALVKEPLLSLKPSLGIINLHTGLSPFVKGGPNCTNWCIANNDWHLVGNTIMWLNAGIDSGNLIATETVDIRNAKNLDDAHIRVMEHAHDLYLRAIRHLTSTPAPHHSIPQKELGEGRLFLTKMWTAAHRVLLLRNWKNRYSAELRDKPKTVNLAGEIQT